MQCRVLWIALGSLVLAGCLAPEKTGAELQAAVAAHAAADTALTADDGATSDDAAWDSAPAPDGETGEVADGGEPQDGDAWVQPDSLADALDAPDTTVVDATDAAAVDAQDAKIQDAKIQDAKVQDVQDTTTLDAPDATTLDAPDSAPKDTSLLDSALLDAGSDVVVLDAADAPDTAKCVAADCDDGNPCTSDSCVVPTGCAHTPIAGPCDDGKACTIESCQAGACKSTATVCDKNATCNEPAGCACKTGFSGDGKYCTALGNPCGNGFLAIDVDGTSVCAPDVPLWGVRPLSLGNTLIDNGDGTVSDPATLLMWQQKATATTYDVAGAFAFCQAATFGGKTDWRLATPAELLTIVDYTVSFPATTAAFDLDATTGYWAARPNVVQADSQWYQWMNYGYSNTDAPNTTEHVLCVRCVNAGCSHPNKAKAGPGRFTTATIAGLDTVQDALTGLTWQRVVTASSAKLDRQAAIDYCMDFADGTWRLPDIAELLTLVDRQHPAPTIDQAAFPNTPPSWFWTSTTWQGKNDEAWYVYFMSGSSNHYPKTMKNYVRCVK